MAPLAPVMQLPVRSSACHHLRLEYVQPNAHAAAAANEHAEGQAAATVAGQWLLCCNAQVQWLCLQFSRDRMTCCDKHFGLYQQCCWCQGLCMKGHCQLALMEQGFQPQG